MSGLDPRNGADTPILCSANGARERGRKGRGGRRRGGSESRAAGTLASRRHRDPYAVFPVRRPRPARRSLLGDCTDATRGHRPPGFRHLRLGDPPPLFPSGRADGVARPAPAGQDPNRRTAAWREHPGHRGTTYNHPRGSRGGRCPLGSRRGRGQPSPLVGEVSAGRRHPPTGSHP